MGVNTVNRKNFKNIYWGGPFYKTDSCRQLRGEGVSEGSESWRLRAACRLRAAHRCERAWAQFAAASPLGHYYKWQRALSQAAWLNKD